MQKDYLTATTERLWKRKTRLPYICCIQNKCSVFLLFLPRSFHSAIFLYFLQIRPYLKLMKFCRNFSPSFGCFLLGRGRGSVNPLLHRTPFFPQFLSCFYGGGGVFCEQYSLYYSPPNMLSEGIHKLHTMELSAGLSGLQIDEVSRKNVNQEVQQYLLVKDGTCSKWLPVHKV